MSLHDRNGLSSVIQMKEKDDEPEAEVKTTFSCLSFFHFHSVARMKRGDVPSANIH